MAAKKLKILMPELVPTPLWGRSASKMLKGRLAWKKIRQETLSAAEQSCSICGSNTGQLSCHENWEYDDKRLTANLVGFEIHCSDCDSVAHAGRAFKLGYEKLSCHTFAL
jgi:hypothetical protein